MDSIDRFIIGTGRSGSTLLSRMLAQNSNILVLSEFFAGVDNLDRFPTDPVSGERFAGMLSGTDEIVTLIGARAEGIKEILYTDEQVRQGSWTGVSGVPTTLSTLAPALDPSDPERLFRDIIDVARAQPTRAVADQYRALFAWLTDRFGRACWVERSGGTLRYYDGMRRTFPRARYVHIHRDGISAAQSMREHNWFILAAEYDERAPTMDELERAIEHPSDSDDDPVARYFSTHKPPLEQFARYWTRQIALGFKEFVHLDEDQYLAVCFEDLQREPERELSRIADFFSLPDDTGWEARGAGLLDASLGRRRRDLPAQELERVHAAVLPGEILLGRDSPGTLVEGYRRMREAFRKFTRS